jgi:hypothetical protein
MDVREVLKKPRGKGVQATTCKVVGAIPFVMAPYMATSEITLRRTDNVHDATARQRSRQEVRCPRQPRQRSSLYAPIVHKCDPQPRMAGSQAKECVETGPRWQKAIGDKQATGHGPQQPVGVIPIVGDIDPYRRRSGPEGEDIPYFLPGTQDHYVSVVTGGLSVAHSAPCVRVSY